MTPTHRPAIVVVVPTTAPSSNNREQALVTLARTQSGCFSATQVAELGFSRNTVRHRVDSGRWERFAYGVYGLPGWVPTSDESAEWQQKLWVASLHAGDPGVCFRRSAGLWHGMDPIEGRPVELLVPLTAGRALRGTVRYRSASLTPEDVTVVRGMTVTTPARTVVDLAAVMMPTRLQRLIKGAIDAEANRVGYMTTRRRWKHLAQQPEATAQLLYDTYMDRARLMRR